VDIGKPIRVLIVDDRAADLDDLCSFLKLLKRIEIVGTGKNGIELMQKAAALRPDLIITDLHIPRINGLECTLRLRAVMPDTRFVIFTDLDYPFTEAECRKPGADFYLYKEHMPERIVTAIHRLFPEEFRPDARPVSVWKEGVSC
jgi:DNA-binding NarL/FixJ family response regulator